MGQKTIPGENKPAYATRHRSKLLLLPLAGIVIFIILYVLAAIKYPGGSHANPDRDGFSFWQNYLCDLLDREAINGEENLARFYARSALGVLCASLLWLWLNIPGLFNNKNSKFYLLRMSGLLAFGSMVFLGAQTHDLIVRIAGIFGLIALINCIWELYKGRYFILFILGLVSIMLFLLNYYIYETGSLIVSLPVIQKLTFALFLSWFVFLNLVLYRKSKMG